MQNLTLQILSGILGIWLAARYIPGVSFEGPIYILLIAGLILGLINFFIKPVLNFITFPLRVITLGLFGLVINMGIIWLVVDIFFPRYLEVTGIKPLFFTTILIWGLSHIFSLLSKK